jgi:hypothetical protein
MVAVNSNEVFLFIFFYFTHVEFGIEPSGSMKCWETIEWPNI